MLPPPNSIATFFFNISVHNQNYESLFSINFNSIQQIYYTPYFTHWLITHQYVNTKQWFLIIFKQLILYLFKIQSYLLKISFQQNTPLHTINITHNTHQFVFTSIWFLKWLNSISYSHRHTLVKIHKFI